MKKITFLACLLLVQLIVFAKVISSTPKQDALTANNQYTAVSKPQALKYSAWLFIQGDKALQIRYAKVKQEGDIIYVKMQMRLNKEDKIFCTLAECQGYIWSYSYEAHGAKISSNIIVKNSYSGIYDYPQLLPVKVEVIDGKFENYWDDATSRYMFKRLDGTDTRDVKLGWSCVDNMLANSSENRCENFNFQTAEVLQ